MASRKQPSAAFWATMTLVVVLVGYPLSFGPACWIASRFQPSGEIVSAIYQPIIWIAVKSWGPVDPNGHVLGAVFAYADVAAKNPSRLALDPPRVWFAPWL
jgi:hypothetical protein